MAKAQFTSYLGPVRHGLERQAAAALEVMGGKAETYAKMNCKKQKLVDTGRLRNSITHRMQGQNAVIIGTNVKYAPYVELGHAQQVGRYVPAIKKRLVKPWAPGYPYLKPAVEEHTDEYKQILWHFLSR